VKTTVRMIRNSLFLLILCTGPVAAAVFPVTNTNDSGAGSFRDAILMANAAGGPDSIDLSAVAGSTIDLSSGVLEITDDLVIEGNGVEIDAGITSRIFSIVNNSVVEIIDASVVRGVSLGGDNNGGGIRCESSNLRLDNVRLFGNQAESGGGLFALNCFVSMAGVVIEDNLASEGGGAWLEGDGVSFSLIDSLIRRNLVTSAAGGLGVTLNGGDFSMSDSEISENTADTNVPGGGFVFNAGNSAGLGMEITEATAEIIRSRIRDNTASDNYGGMGASIDNNAEITIDSSTFSGNSAGQNTGGMLLIVNDISTGVVINTTISGNSAGDDVGGATITSENDSEVELIHLTITDNQSADETGGMIVGAGNITSLLLSAIAIADNTALTDPDLGVFGSSAAFDVVFSLIGVLPSNGILNTDPTTDLLIGESISIMELSENGGPTLTHLPFLGSSLLDQIPPGENGCGTGITNDQRSEIRPDGLGCDIGAVEGFGDPPPPPPEAVAVDTLTPNMMMVLIALITLVACLVIRRQG